MPAIKLLFATSTPFLDNCTNLLGHLKPDVRKRLLAVLNRPNQKNWDNAYSIIIEGRRMTTLWQAVLAVDPTFTRSKPCDETWPLIPDQFTLCRAIRNATTAATAQAEEQQNKGYEQDEHQTAVIFRKWRKKEGSGIIALFPEIPCDAYRYYCLSYERIGQHGGADYNGVIARTVPANEEEFGDLKRELEAVGYNLAVYQRRTAQMREKLLGRTA